MSQSDLFHAWDGAADWFLRQVGMGDEPVDIWQLAEAWGFRVDTGRPRSFVSAHPAGVIWLSAAQTPEQQRFCLAHELGHVADELTGGSGRDELAASRIAAGLLCPPQPFKRDLRRHRWDLERMREIYGVSWEVCARRIADLRSAVVTIHDQGEVTARVASHWIRQPYVARVERFELDVINEALATEAHVYRSDLLRGWYVPGSDGWRRVIVVAGLEEYEEAAARGRDGAA
jgi:hypothetical protein